MPVRGARLTPSFSINMGALWSISLSNSRVKYSWKNVERERERVLAKRSAKKGAVVVVLYLRQGEQFRREEAVCYEYPRRREGSGEGLESRGSV